MNNSKLIRITTVPQSLKGLLKSQLKFLNQYYEVVGVSSSGDALKEVAKNENIRTIPVDIKRRISLFNDIKSLIGLYKVFKKEKPKIIHSITPKAGLLSMLAGKFARVPVRIHTFTGLIFPSKTGVYQSLLIWMDRLLCYCATNIYPEGEGVKKDLINYRITKKPLRIIANGNVNGIDTSYFNPLLFSEDEKNKLRNDLNISKDDFVFIFVGRLVKDKGINELVRAFKKLNNKYSNTKLLLVGPYEKELDPLLEETEEEIRNNTDIIEAGYQQDVRPYFALSDVLTFPSYREGFPNVVMQAGAMGLPSIVTDINGCNEIIIEGKNGIIISPKDDVILAEKMEQIFLDSDLRNKLKENARDMIRSRYEQKMVWEAILEEYKRLESQYV